MLTNNISSLSLITDSLLMIQSFVSSVWAYSSNYAGLAELVGLEGGEVAHISISEGRVLALRVYSTLPGSKIRGKMLH